MVCNYLHQSKNIRASNLKEQFVKEELAKCTFQPQIIKRPKIFEDKSSKKHPARDSIDQRIL